MALPVIDSNLVGCRVYPVTDLAMASSLPNATPVVSTAFSTGAPGTVIVLAQLSSGTQTIDIRVDNTAADAVANIGTPTATMSLSSTTKFYQSVATTSNAALQVNDYPPSHPSYVAPDSDLWVALKQTGAAGGSILAQLVILSLYELIGGEDWYSIRAGGFNAVAGTGGVGNVTAVTPSGFQDGTGALTMTSF